MEEGGTVLPASFSAILSFLHLGHVFWPRLLFYTKVQLALISKEAQQTGFLQVPEALRWSLHKKKLVSSHNWKRFCTHKSPRRYLIISEAPPISPGESPQCCLQSLLLKRRISEVRVRRGPRRGRGGFLLFTPQVRALRGSSAPCWTGWLVNI